MPRTHEAFTLGRRTSDTPAWLIPSFYAVTAVALGLTLPRMEAAWLPGWKAGLSAAAATAIYSAVAGGMITLTGIVFSLVFVMVQFSATAYSPRLVLWMSRDPMLSHAIGVFTATALYAIAALAWVDRTPAAGVPFVSGWLVVGLLLASVGVFIGLVQRVSRLQVNSVLVFTAQFGRQNIDIMYPPLEAEAETATTATDLGPVTQTLVFQGIPQSLQSLDVRGLLSLAERSDALIELTASVGDTLVLGTPVLRVHSGRELIPERDLRRAVHTGLQRTFEQDPKYSLHLLADIAIRALSPAVNDPTTAVQALDQLEDLLLRLSRRKLDVGNIRDGSGKLRLVIPMPTWDDYLDLAFSQIRYFGGTSMQVTRRMKALLTDLMQALPEERRPAVIRQQQALDRTIARSFPDPEDRLEASAEDREGFGATRRNYTTLLVDVTGK